MAMRLGVCPAAALRTRAHATVGLLAIAVLEVLRQYCLGLRGDVPMALLHFLKKLYQLLIASALSILEILHTRLAALQGVIEYADDVVRLVAHARFLLSHSRCTL